MHLYIFVLLINYTIAGFIPCTYESGIVGYVLTQVLFLIKNCLIFLRCAFACCEKFCCPLPEDFQSKTEIPKKSILDLIPISDAKNVHITINIHTSKEPSNRILTNTAYKVNKKI